MKIQQFAFIDHESSGDDLRISEILEVLRRNIRLIMIFAFASSDKISIGSAYVKKLNHLNILCKKDSYGCKGFYNEIQFTE